MKKFMRLFAAFSLALPLVLVGMAQPASAGFGDMRDQCGLGYYCLMGDANWRMCIGGFTGNDSDYADNACWDGVVGHYLDNRATSVFNNGYAGAPDDIQSFRHPNYVEMIWFVPQGNYYSNVDQWCGALPCNDQASSHRWV
ncbi:hypothetical protein SK571_08155 [Lentzea sp. BCCO 10_0798]|jgi:hypothetical protein|uniref:Peptidase inhibitor family I36 n=1 Tax=Lentzea kristufekii TaxID=3095430 RepID=A0ABU4TM92_9PSEU|nr:hypothetical protein [Lentzea sp. BCCO 10_0798]MDX8049350.1 hypothetical protein [Lentzea sp. BCCO 10_0798]